MPIHITSRPQSLAIAIPKQNLHFRPRLSGHKPPILPQRILEPVHNLPLNPKSPFLAHNLQNFRNVSIDTPQKLLKILTTKIFNSGSEREIMNRLLGYVSLGIEGLWLTYPSP